ncbi:hypothetical protein CkaCkLH20_03294 [Colletotrichum karsti]|uniref:Uncharacterized protein n=1 Tax=Colletotrichum karsti TaxID=1095194 RepID=A0A9P6LND1_9PEZI|nr:uncharacterized protein CkaCkLH20_03294 [Colletotrichum karsti]KAF9879061.1 hypothetical protein CkaCkLH20_03294 [Colletotrichum karsti]
MQFNLFAVAALLACEAFASKITYACRYNGKDLQGKDKVVTEQKAGGTIPDDKDDDVVNDIGKWSNNDFSAKKNARTGIVIVTNTKVAKNKAEATDQNNEAQQIVKKHT